MRQRKEVLIGETNYIFSHFPPTKSWAILTRLLKIIGGPLGVSLDTGSAKKIEDVKINMGAVIQKLFENLDSPEGQKLVNDLLDNVYVDNEAQPLKPRIETHFLGNMSEMMEVLAAQIRFQYDDVFTKLASKLNVGMLAGIITKPQNTSVGQSGES